MSKLLIGIALVICVHSRSAAAQDSKLALSAGVGMGFNRGRTADFAVTSGNMVAGAGYNFSRSITAMLEYQYYNLEVRPLLIAVAGAESSVASVESVSASLLFRPKNKIGIYGIAGMGWYRRLIDLRGPSPVPEMSSDSAIGINAGSGLEFPISGKLKMFGELRYHYAYTSKITTQILPVTFGFRW
jgi:opacity protein-like surface antigen